MERSDVSVTSVRGGRKLSSERRNGGTADPQDTLPTFRHA